MSHGDHPRGCGENYYAELEKLCSDGITPADAGKTRNSRRTQIMHWDHPRGCGENILVTPRSEHEKGSPPRMRGKLLSGASRKQLHGITPADAGKTVPVFGHRAHNRDHPRGCGENESTSIAVAKQTGSPPRMRGKH